jgi:hypothetical protein
MIETLAKTGKKALTVSVVGTTIAWATGVAAFVPMLAGAATLTDGDLIKASGPAVYYYRGTDGKRCPFPNDKVFYSWFSDFKSVKTLTDAELAAVGLCSTPMTYRSGTRLVKIATDPKVYAIEIPNTLRHVADEATAKALFGDNWNKQIDDVPDVFFGNYSASDKQVTTAMPPAGFVFKASDTAKLYYIDKDTAGAYSKREVTDLNAFKANGWKEKDIRSVAPTVLASLTAGTAIAAAEKVLSMPQFAAAPAGQQPTQQPVVVTGNVTVALDASSPATGGTLVTGATADVAGAGQSGAKLATFSLMNGTNAEVKITSLALKRIGVSADTTLASVYLYEGVSRLSDAASVSSGSITFNSSAGLFSIAAGATKKVWVAANIAGATSGQTVGVGILNAASIVTSPAATIAGTFPVNGNLLSIAQATLATVSYGAVTPAAANIDPQNDYVMWQSTATIGVRAVNLKKMSFREVGSGDFKDIKNFRLLVDGAQVAGPIADLDSNGYVTFDLSSAAKKLETGGRVIKVLADIIGGTSRTFSLSLRDVADSSFEDVDYNAAVTPNVGGAAFSARTSGDQTVNAGTLTITKVTDSPSGNVVLSGTGILLGKYTLTATGENMKVESLYARAIRNGGAGAATITLRNGALYANGVQVGSTTSLATVAAGTQYSLGSSLIVEPGKPVTLEIKADIFDNNGANDIAATDTLQASIVGTANNVLRSKTLSYGTFPGIGADVNANVLTVASGSLTLTKDQAYGNQNVVAPKQNVLLGQWSLTNAGAVEDVNLNTLTVDFTFADEFAAADLTNAYVKYGTKTGSTKATVSATAGANTWSINETLAKGGTLMIQVYGDIAAGAVVTETTPDTVIPSLLVAGTTAMSSTAVNTNSNAVLAGQTITALTAGILTVSVDPSSPVAAQSIAGTTSDGALKLKLSGTREDLYVKDITFRADTTDHEVSVASMSLWQSAAVNGPWTQVGDVQPYSLSTTANMPGTSRWTLSGDGRVKVSKDSTVYLLVKPTYVSSNQTAPTANWMPYIFLSDIQVEGSTGALAASGTGANLVNASGIIIQANASATYVDSTENNTAADMTATATTLVTGNTIVFSPGDVIFIDENNDGTWDRATEELMVVLQDGGANLLVQRGAFGTTAVAYTADTVNIYRLSGLVATYTYAGVVGSIQYVVPNKLSLGISSTGYVHGSAQKVATLTTTAGTNAADSGQNNVTLTYVDLTVSKSTASVNNVIMYPAQFDLNATYLTSCGAMSVTKWRCTMSTAGSTNQITEGSAVTYNVYADVGYSNTGGSVEFSIANLGTGPGADVSWTSSVPLNSTTVAQTWVYQGVTQIKAGQQQTTAAVNDTDVTGPVVSSVVIAGTADNQWTVGDTVTITFSEPINAATVVTTNGTGTLVPSGTAALGTATVTAVPAVTGYLSRSAAATSACVVPGIFNNLVCGGDTQASGSQAASIVSLALSANSRVLTITVTTAGALVGAAVAEAYAASTPLTTTIFDAALNSTGTALQNTVVTPAGNL